MYHCGPTVYNYAHIGNLRAYVFADILRRTFEHEGYQVNQVINITDVGHLVSDADEGEDKMERGARREGKTAREIALFYEDAFMHDLELLNIRTNGTLFPRASEHIPEQIALIQKLEEKGVTYRTEDGIYFDTSKISDYGKLDRENIAGLKEGARIEKNAEKRNITDFALWKFSKPGEKRQQEWDSPWGKGFPGWHLECSAMAMKYLGETFDIHTGGIDHIQIHHTNEIAQSETATGKVFSRYFLHVAFVNVAEGKMSKSEENFLRLETLAEQGIHPLYYRYSILTAHYRSQITFSWEALEAARSALDALFAFFSPRVGKGIGSVSGTYMDRFKACLADDLNTPQAIAVLFELIKDEHIPEATKIATIAQFDHILGLGLTERFSELERELLSKTIHLEDVPAEIRTLIAKREEAREKKDWQEADLLRDNIEKQGYTIQDGEQGPVISRKNRPTAK